MVKLKYKVIWDDEAKASLKNIYNYIKKRESIVQARKVVNEIRDLAKNLGFIPHKFIKDPLLEDESGDNRFKCIWDYKIVYEITNDFIIILDVFHTSRDPQKLKNIKRK